MNRATKVGVLGLSIAIAACASAPDAPTATDASRDKLTIAASDATRRELGVDHWSLDTRENESPLEGLDATGRSLVQFQHVAQNDGDRQLDAYLLKQGDAVARVVLEEDASGVTVHESSFEGKSLRTAELLASDLRAAPAKGAASPGSSLTASSFGGELKPQSPPPTLTNQECATLVSNCNSYPLRRRAAQLDLAQFCLPTAKREEVCSAQKTDLATCVADYKKKCDAAGADRGDIAERENECANDMERLAECKHRLGE